MKDHMLVFLVCSFFVATPMQIPASVECLAQLGHPLYILYLADQKKMEGNYTDALALAQRYQIRVAQDAACCTDKSAGERAFKNLKELITSDYQWMNYIEQMSIEKYIELYKKQLNWAENLMNTTLLPEPVWLEPFCTTKNNKIGLFLNSNLWHQSRRDILEKYQIK